jgi:hypothetical protein
MVFGRNYALIGLNISRPTYYRPLCCDGKKTKRASEHWDKILVVIAIRMMLLVAIIVGSRPWVNIQVAPSEDEWSTIMIIWTMLQQTTSIWFRRFALKWDYDRVLKAWWIGEDSQSREKVRRQSSKEASSTMRPVLFWRWLARAA